MKQPANKSKREYLFPLGATLLFIGILLYTILAMNFLAKRVGNALSEGLIPAEEPARFNLEQLKLLRE